MMLLLLAVARLVGVYRITVEKELNKPLVINSLQGQSEPAPFAFNQL